MSIFGEECMKIARKCNFRFSNDMERLSAYKAPSSGYNTNYENYLMKLTVSSAFKLHNSYSVTRSCKVNSTLSNKCPNGAFIMGQQPLDMQCLTCCSNNYPLIRAIKKGFKKLEV